MRPGGEMLEQQRADAATAVPVRHEYRELGAMVGVAGSFARGDAHDDAGLVGEQGQVPIAVRLAEPIHLRGQRTLAGTQEEPRAQALW